MANRKLTKQELIRRFKSKHGERYDYSLSEFVDSKTKIKIICHTHGIFEQTPVTHFKSGCRACANDGLLRMSTEDFLQQSKRLHEDKYDYSLVNFRSKLEEVIIICPEHGPFTQLPKLHLKGHGCGWCGGAKKYTNEMFIKKAGELHNHKYDYRKFEYSGFQEKGIIICPDHGEFLQNPAGHFRGEGCPHCGLLSRNNKRRTKEEDFIEVARSIHGSKYDYSKVEITTLKKPVKIICSIHGIFMQAPASHTRGSNCPECVLIDSRGFSRSQYIKVCEQSSNGASTLYIIECNDEKERFFKVGITKENIAKRFAYGKLPYKYKVIASYRGAAGYVYDLETQVHRMLSDNKYIPLKNFGGKHECFSAIPKNIVNMVLGLGKQPQIQLIA